MWSFVSGPFHLAHVFEVHSSLRFPCPSVTASFPGASSVVVQINPCSLHPV